MKNYVTGANGFIGSHLMRRFLNAEAIPHQQISKAKLKNFENFFFLSSYGNLFQHTDWNAIVKANISDLVCILREVRRQTPSTFIFVSTSIVTMRVQTPYACCKMAAEHILAGSNSIDRRTIVARPYSVTGAGEQPSHLIPALIRSCMKGEEIPFYPDATHDFVDVSDLVDGLCLLAEKADSGIYEFGRGLAVSNAEVKSIVEKVTGKAANVKMTTFGRPYDSKSWFCKNDAATKLGWVPKKSLEQSIREMVNEYDNPAKAMR